MPVLWTVFHSARLVEISAEGTVLLKDMQECVEGITAPATLSYRKLVDLSAGKSTLRRDDIAVLAEYARECAGIGPMGGTGDCGRV
jgi:hypothetical protein